MVHRSCATPHRSVRLLGGVRQPWGRVSPRAALWLAVRLGLCLGLGRTRSSYKKGAAEAAWCEVGCARAGAPAQEAWLQVQNELPRGWAENNVLRCLFLPSYQKGRRNGAFLSCEGKGQRLKEVLPLQAGEQYLSLKKQSIPLN